MSTRFPTRALPFVLPLMLASLLAACSKADADPRNEPPTVRIATAGIATSGGGSYSGIISSRVQSDLGFRVAGKVVARLVDAGQTVRRGQPLMRIDATDYALASRTQAGSVAAARATAIQTAADERRYRDLVGRRIGVRL
jgi:multidrug efflux pump subunit AcrA (membrane-fusion protein)